MSKRKRGKPAPREAPPAHEPRRRRGRSPWALTALVLLLAAAAYGATRFLASRPDTSSWELPAVDIAEMPAPVRAQLSEAQQRVERERDSAEAWGQLGGLYDIYTLYGPAVACYERARTLAPEEFRWAYFLAMAEDARGADLERVTATFRAAIELKPGYVPVLYRFADALIRRGRTTEARELYTQVVQLEPQLAVGHRGLGQALLSLGQHQEGVRSLERAAQLAPDDRATYIALARGYALVGDQARAASTAELSERTRGLPVLPDSVRAPLEELARDPDSCILRAQAAMQAGAFARAIPDLKLFLEVLPEHALAQYFLGSAYLETGQAELAVEALTAAVAIQDDLVEAHLKLVDIHTRSQRFDAAIEHLRRALAHAGSDAGLHAKLGHTLAVTGDLEGAIASFQRAAALRPGDAEIHHNLGTALMRHGDSRAAVRQFRLALEIKPDYPNTLYNLGTALEQLGRVDEAIPHYRRAVELDPAHVSAKRLQELGVSL
jgi:tetratricopeptide (TPR) repeat protein